MSQHLPLDGISTIRIITRSGSVTVRAEERSDVLLETEEQHTADRDQNRDGELVITAPRPSAKVTARCPVGLHLVIGTDSGSIRLAGDFGNVRVTTTSGNVDIERARSLDVRSASGRVAVQDCAKECIVHVASGRVDLGRVGSARVSTVSAAVSVGRALGEVRAQTVSGSVEVEGEADVFVQSMSGTVKAKVPAGLHPTIRLSSPSGTSQDECHECGRQLAIRTISGHVEVTAGQ